MASSQKIDMKFDKNTIMDLLDFLYSMALDENPKIRKKSVQKLAEEYLESNQALGFRLVTKFGETGVVNLHKAIPIVGGAIGGCFDGYSCYKTGQAARKLFFDREVPTCFAIK